MNTLTPVKARYDQAKIDADSVISGTQLFPQVQSSINTKFGSILNSKFGLLKGLNCRVIGHLCLNERYLNFNIQWS